MRISRFYPSIGYVLKMRIAIWNALVFQGMLLNGNRGLFLWLLNANEAAACAHIVHSRSVPQTLLEQWDACGFLAAVAKQNNCHLFNFGWLLVACLCGPLSLSFASKTLGGVSVSDLSQNERIFNCQAHHRNWERCYKRKEKDLLEQFNLHSSLSIISLA